MPRVIIVSGWESRDWYEKEIVKVYKTFYKWKYLDNETVFDSRNSNDPTFYWWELKQ